jgi:uncharacterized protein (DUF58 family)
MAKSSGGEERFGPVRDALTEAKGLAAGLPDLLIEARRVASIVVAGWHGRRTSGRGETFWQFRPFMPDDTHAGIDWRRSARDNHLYVRETEWEAAHTVWLWADLSESMNAKSRLAAATKRDRAVVILLALAELLAAAGERVGLLGLSPPILARNAAERLAEFLAHVADGRTGIDARALGRLSDVVLIGDFFDPIEEIETSLEPIMRSGARAHLVQVVDPIEETFPFTGRIEFRDPESGFTHLLDRSEQHRGEYERLLAAHRERLARSCQRLAWTFLVHRTDRPATDPLLALDARLADRHGKTSGIIGDRAA